MASIKVNYENLEAAIKAVDKKVDIVKKYINSLNDISDQLDDLNSKHECFPVTMEWIEALHYKLNHYEAKLEELSYLCGSVIGIFEKKENELSVNAQKLKEFNSSVASKELYKLVTGKEGQLNITGKTIDKLKDKDLTGAYKTSYSTWNNTKLSSLKGRDWIDRDKVAEVTGAFVATKATSTRDENPSNATTSPKVSTPKASGSGNSSNNVFSSAGVFAGGTAAVAGSALSGVTATTPTTTTDEEKTTAETETKDTKSTSEKYLEILQEKYNEIKTSLEEKQQAALDKAISDASNNANATDANNNQTTNPTQNNTTEITDKIDAAKTEINNNISNTENKITDKMEEVKQAVEEKSKPVEQPQQTTTKVVEKPVVKQTPTETVEKVPEAPKTETTPVTPNPVEEPVEPTPVETDPSIPDESDIDTPEPKHTVVPKDDSSTVTKVPKEESSGSSSSSGGASKVVPVVAGVAAAGAAGVGTKIYLDSKSAPENKYINEEFVVDDSDYTASNYETAEVGTDADLLHEESSTYTTRANSETTDSKDDMLGDGISDDLTYGMNVTDNDMTFDESTPYEAIDNYEMGETH